MPRANPKRVRRKGEDEVEVVTHPDMFEGESPMVVEEGSEEDELRIARIEEIGEAIAEIVDNIDRQMQDAAETDEDTASEYFESLFEQDLVGNAGYYLQKVAEEDERLSNLIDEVGEETAIVEIMNPAFFEPGIQAHTHYTIGGAVWQVSNDHNEYETELEWDDDFSKLHDELLEIATAEEIHELEEEISSISDAYINKLGRSSPEITGYTSFTVYATPQIEEMIAHLEEIAGDFDEDDDDGEPDDIERVWESPSGEFVVDDLQSQAALKTEGRKLGICVGNIPSYWRGIKRGTKKILSLRTASGKPKFTIEAHIDNEGKIDHIDQVKGKANRIPGFSTGRGGGKFKPTEVETLNAFFADIGVDPSEIEDMQPALDALREPRKNPSWTWEDDGNHCGFCCEPRHA